MSAGSPYATILVPTHDRPETLPLAVRSACRQTVQNIEILIACDGATPETLEAAHDLAAMDKRVRVLDLPKGSNRGGQARAAALTLSRSDRIMILQDDDLWFPDNVATLGPLLDDHDVATTATLAVRPSGSVTKWVSNYAYEPFRRIAEATGYKLVFEANYAFRLNSYHRRGVRWDAVPAAGNIKRLLDCHLGDPAARWISVAAPCALSFNSPNRRATSMDDRAEEMRSWLDRIESGTIGSDIAALAQSGAALGYSAIVSPPEPRSSLQSYLASLGLTARSATGRHCEEALLAMELNDDQRVHLACVFGLLTGDVIGDHSALESALFDLMEPFAGPDPRCWAAAELLADAVGYDAGTELAEAMTETDSAALRSLAHGLAGSLLMQRRDSVAAARHVRAALETDGPFDSYFRSFAEKLPAPPPSSR